MKQSIPWKNLLFFAALYFALAFAAAHMFKKDNYRYQLSVIAIFQNEDRFLKEWIDFYRVMGVEHFYLFNNISDDNYLAVLQPYIDQGMVELFDWPYASRPGSESDWTRIQSSAYRQGLDSARGQSKWAALVDTDEFMFPRQEVNLVEFLKNYEECSSVLVNWQVFGTSNVAKIPDNQLMIETLLMQSAVDAEMNTFCKSLVRPEKVKYCNDPHAVIHYPWSYSVDPDKHVFRWKFHKLHPVKIDKIRVNHYWSRDEEFFFTNKLARYENWGNQKQACVARNNDANQIENREILAWVPRIYGQRE